MLEILMYILYFIFGIIIPALVSVVIYIWLKKRQSKIIYRILAFVPLGIMTILVVDDIYTSTTFSEKQFIDDYENTTHTRFLKSSKIIFSHMSYRNFPRIYDSALLVELENPECLENKLKKYKFVEIDSIVNFPEINHLENKMQIVKYRKRYVCKSYETYFYVFFPMEGKSVVIANKNVYRY